MHWQSRIEAALEEDRFELHLQPIMNIATGRISSAEVLLRLRDEDELVPPSRFVYISERVGLMPQVDAWVVDNSLAMLARILMSGPIVVTSCGVSRIAWSMVLMPRSPSAASPEPSKAGAR